MNRGPLIFLGLFFVLALSWFGLVLIPQIQLGGLKETVTIGAEQTYPVSRDGLARQGAEVYRANGCVQCHSQQVRQSGVSFDVVLKSPGTNHAAILAAVRNVNPALSGTDAEKLLAEKAPVIVKNVTKPEADNAKKALEVHEAQALVQVIPQGADIARGYGVRRTVATDYLFDRPVQLGSQRIGPDLANIGARSRGDQWQLQHLYAPRSLVEGSTMPPYPYLFERRQIVGEPSPDALQLTGRFAPPEGWEVVPKPAALSLVAYLNSLKSDAPLLEGPAPVAVISATSATNKVAAP